eukprot:12073990-Alexandrium_andersonii.AAC.1
MGSGRSFDDPRANVFRAALNVIIHQASASAAKLMFFVLGNVTGVTKRERRSTQTPVTRPRGCCAR